MEKIKVAVFFGGQSFEHDVSILTGIQAIEVMDITKYEPIPVYVDKEGLWWTGKSLTDTKTYPITNYKSAKVKQISLSTGDSQTPPHLKIKNACIFGEKYINFDIVLLAFHGGVGESGGMQGIFESNNIPYTGANITSSAIYMNKFATKCICRSLGINVLEEIIITKPTTGNFIDIKAITKDIKVKYPVCAKPLNLGSSVGVYKAKNIEELSAAILNIFKLDSEVIIEPFVENLIEYNIAVIKGKKGEIITSAIESPNNNDTFLSFEDKYGANGGKKKGLTISAMPSDELVNSRRIFTPKLSSKTQKFIEVSAKKLFATMGRAGSPRIDFLADGKKDLVWLNEVNPIPGAFAFYIWENSKPAINYSDLISIIIENGFKDFDEKNKDIDLKTSSSVIFKKK